MTKLELSLKKRIYYLKNREHILLRFKKNAKKRYKKQLERQLKNPMLDKYLKMARLAILTLIEKEYV